MKKYSIDSPILKINSNSYLKFIMFIAPFLNFLPGLNLDMYAPSMPAIAKHFSVSVMIVKNTMSATLPGMMVGCIVFGLLIDSLGRKNHY